MNGGFFFSLNMFYTGVRLKFICLTKTLIWVNLYEVNGARGLLLLQY